MSKHLQRDLEHLKKAILAIGTRVEEAVQKSILAFEERRGDLASLVQEEDEKIDQREVGVEEECLRLLALHQPVAEDLRLIAAVMKINSDLERMGDYAVTIARRTSSLLKEAPIPIPGEFKAMATLVVKLIHEALDSFVRKDVALAMQICKQDEEVDQYNNRMIKELKLAMHATPDRIDQLLDFFTVIRQLERLADLSTNIAEDVIYLVEGEIVRHRLS